jgi:hypothetical protein
MKLHVTLFATLDSVTAAVLDGVCPHGYAEDPRLDGRVWEALHVSHALARSGEFELVHNHLDWLPLAFSEHARAPMVTTVHGFSGAGILPAYPRSRSAFVAISDSDRYAGLGYAATIYHGIDLRMLPYRAAQGDYLVSRPPGSKPQVTCDRSRRPAVAVQSPRQPPPRADEPYCLYDHDRGGPLRSGRRCSRPDPLWGRTFDLAYQAAVAVLARAR